MGEETHTASLEHKFIYDAPGINSCYGTRDINNIQGEHVTISGYSVEPQDNLDVLFVWGRVCTNALTRKYGQPSNHGSSDSVKKIHCSSEAGWIECIERDQASIADGYDNDSTSSYKNWR